MKATAAQWARYALWSNSTLALLIALCSLAGIATIRQAHGEPGRDGMPIALGAKMALAGINPYHEQDAIRAVFNLPGTTTCSSCGQIGLVYPATALVVALPFAALPLDVAQVTFALSITGLAMMLLAMRLYQVPYALAVWYLPISQGFGVGNVLLLGTALLLLAARVPAQAVWLRALLLVVAVALKPHSVILIAAWLALGDLRERRILPYAAWGGLILALSFVIAPDWIPRWNEQMHLYRVVEGEGSGSIMSLWWLLPLAAILWRRNDHLGAIVVTQVALAPAIAFPYAVLPIIIIAIFESKNRGDTAIFTWLWAPAGYLYFIGMSLLPGTAAFFGVLASTILPALIYRFIQTYSQHDPLPVGEPVRVI